MATLVEFGGTASSLSSGASSRNRAFSPSSRRLVRGTSRDTSSARLRLLVSRACRIRDAEPSASNALLQASAPSKPPHQPLRYFFSLLLLRRGFAARRSRQSHERVSRAQRDFDPRRCRARALHARQNHAGGLPAKLGSGELSGRSAVRRAAGANQSAGTYGNVYAESWRC